MNQREILIQALRDRGERLTVAESLERYGIYALSQRAGELIRDGYPIKSELVKLPNGKRVAKYSWMGQGELGL